MQSLMKETQEQALAVLNAEQKEKFEKLKGAKLDIPASELSFGGRPRNP